MFVIKSNVRKRDCGCQKKKSEREIREEEPALGTIARIVFNIFGPLPPSLIGNLNLLVIKDVGTRESMLEALPTRAAVGVAKTIYKRVCLSVRTRWVFQSDLQRNLWRRL